MKRHPYVALYISSHPYRTPCTIVYIQNNGEHDTNLTFRRQKPQQILKNYSIPCFINLDIVSNTYPKSQSVLSIISDVTGIYTRNLDFGFSCFYKKKFSPNSVAYLMINEFAKLLRNFAKSSNWSKIWPKLKKSHSQLPQKLDFG